MNNQLSLQEIKKFRQKFNENKKNKETMKNINANGLNTYSINEEIIKENKPEFNIELSETRRMNQKDSERCWIYSGLNFIKRNIAQNLNIDILNFELSPTFIAFYDRLEKANHLYNNVIYKKFDLKEINRVNFFETPNTERGRFELFRAIVDKYGIVPYRSMKDTKDSINSKDYDLILNEKIKKDCIKLKQCKEKGEDYYILKNKLLYEDYEFLCKVIGQPPEKFNFSYINLNNDKIILQNITPLEFKERFLSIDLNEYVGVANIENYDRNLYKIYRKKDSGNVYKKSYIEFINLPLIRLKQLVTNQLEDNEPVIFDCEIIPFRDKKSGILDTRLYNYDKFLPYKNLSRIESINYKDIFARHVMNFTGVQIENGKFIRWKVEDSYGEKEKHNGYYIMNDNYFDKYVIRIIINKKYLTDKEIQTLNSKQIIVDNFDGF